MVFRKSYENTGFIFNIFDKTVSINRVPLPRCSENPAKIKEIFSISLIKKIYPLIGFRGVPKILRKCMIFFISLKKKLYSLIGFHGVPKKPTKI